MMLNNLKTGLRAAGVAALLMTATAPLAMAGQLEDIMASGVLRVGTDTGFPPFGYLDEKLEPTGSDIDTARQLAKDWGLEIEFVDTVSGTRVSNLLSNRVDLIISSLAKNAERAEVIDFTIPYSVIQAVVGGDKSLSVASIDDLNGMTVAVTRGAVPDFVLGGIADEKGFTLQRFDNDAALVTAGVTGQAKVVATAGNIIFAITERNSDFEEKFVQKTYLLHFGLRKDAPELMAKVNGWIRDNLENGMLNATHEKYHFKTLAPEVMEASK